MINYSTDELWKQDPLLNNSGRQTATNENNNTVMVIQKRYTHIDLMAKKRMWRTNIEALWAIFSLMLQVLPEIYNTAVLSHYGNASVVAGAGLGVMFINMFVYGIFEGLNGAIDTLVSQSYGSKDYYTCNLVFNRAKMINSIIFVPVAALLIFSSNFLDFLRQPPEVSKNAELYLAYQIPGLFFVVHFDTLRRFLQAQEIFDLPTKTLIFTFTVHVVIVTSTLHYMPYNPIIVCAVTTNVTLVLDYIILYWLSIEQLNLTNFLSPFKGAFDEWGEYMSLALPSAFILCAEWWMYEVLAIFAGLLGVVYLATLIIIFNTHNLVYDISYGLSQAASAQIGNTLAEIGKKTAKKILRFIVFLQFIICIVICVSYLTWTRGIINLYTKEDDIVDLFISCKYLIAAMFVIDSSQILLGGVIRGIGEQGESSIISFISYGLITLPLTLLLSFWFDLKLHGILWAYIAGITFSTIFNTWILLKSDWELTIEDDEDDQPEYTLEDYTKL